MIFAEIFAPDSRAQNTAPSEHVRVNIPKVPREELLTDPAEN